jgi:transposase InsO family protein
MKQIHPVALFRLTVLGPLASRDRFSSGELKIIIKDLAEKTYAIPNSKRVYLSETSIERWYYAWKKGGIDALAPLSRKDNGQSQLSSAIQEAILNAKRDKPSRSINQLIRLLEMNLTVGKGQLSRSSVYRVLKYNKLTARIVQTPETIERRSFVAEHCGQIWQGDVLHGPKVVIKGQYQKTYLVSFMDDASRLIVHSEFRLSETALDIQSVLKQALLKRGIPNRIILDNGSAYRSGDLQAICARIQIRLVFCRPYAPQGKGKLERWHSRIRSEFLDELDLQKISSLSDLNARLWAYLDQIYHITAHEGLENHLTPIERWRNDLVHVRQLGTWATQIDEMFYHREQRQVRKDGCVSINGQWFEVPYELTGEKVLVVFDPETNEAKWVESLEGKRLGQAVLLDKMRNTNRKRQRPTQSSTTTQPYALTPNTVELAYALQQASLLVQPSQEK